MKDCSISFARGLALSGALLVVSANYGHVGENLATGVVFEDANHNGTYEEFEPPLTGVRVSNGRDIVSTDAAGRYQLAVTDDTTIFVIKPRGYRTPLNKHNLPQFYYIHKPHGSPHLHYPGVPPTGDLPESIDFPLYKQREPNQFKALLFGDPQPRDQKEVDYIAHDVVETLIGTDASFGVTLGDIVFDDLNMFEPQARVIAMLGIPWYNVIGNHDLNQDAQRDEHSDETFEHHFGPNYYSFDYGPVHFLVLDDVQWYVEQETGEGTYRGGLGARQLEFIRRDLTLIPAKQLVVFMMHVPLTGVDDRQDLYRLIEQRPFCMSISAHTHLQEHRFITREDGWRGPRPHHHVINVTVSGSWWQGAPDERGIPHTTMADGAPNGYSVMSFDGHRYQLTYRAAARPADYQMSIDLPEEVTLAELPETRVYVNVFAGSVRSTVELRVGAGPWQPLHKRWEFDPQYQRVCETEAAVIDKLQAASGSITEPWRKLPQPKLCSHLWRGQLPHDLAVGVHLIQIRTTDMHGRVYRAERSVRVVKTSPPHREKRSEHGQPVETPASLGSVDLSDRP